MRDHEGRDSFFFRGSIRIDPPQNLHLRAHQFLAFRIPSLDRPKRNPEPRRDKRWPLRDKRGHNLRLNVVLVCHSLTP